MHPTHTQRMARLPAVLAAAVFLTALTPPPGTVAVTLAGTLAGTRAATAAGNAPGMGSALSFTISDVTLPAAPRLVSAFDADGDGAAELIVLGASFGQLEAQISVLDNDGTLEFVVGTPGENDDDDAGGIWLLSLEDGPWFDLGFGLLFSNNKPRLEAEGILVDNALIELQLSRAKANAPATLVVGFSSLFAPFKGGTLVPSVDLLIGATTDGLGKLDIPAIWPPGVPQGVAVWFQWWISDEVGVLGFAASNGLQAYVP